MKYLRFKKDSIDGFGILQDNTIKVLRGDFLEEVAFSGDEYSLEEVELLTPVKPGKVIAVGLNYMDHIKEFGDRPVPENPTLFIKLTDTIIGPGKAIILPKGYKRVDFEAELAVVISKYCYKVSAEDAQDCIFGATCLNDVTERAVQKADGQWTRGKNFPTFCPIGPHIETDIDLSDLEVRAVLNGEVKQLSSTKHFLWNPYELVSFISQSIPLEPGDVVTTGTPSGVGPMKSGDTISIEIEKIGALVNPVIDEK